MKDFSNAYVFKFSFAMVFIVALLLSLAATFLQPMQERNERTEKKRNILSAIQIQVNANEASSYYNKAITDQFVVNSKGERVADHEPLEIDLRLEIAKQDNEMLLPVYVGKNPSGKKTYIFPVHGKGLWGAVWGYIALREDLNTIEGVYFDHAKETPGLGAEIADSEFQDQFKQKKLFDDAQQFQSVSVLKNTGDADNPHSVQALSGATITSRGVSNMLRDNMRYYLPFIHQEKKHNN